MIDDFDVGIRNVTKQDSATGDEDERSTQVRYIGGRDEPSRRSTNTRDPFSVEIDQGASLGCP